MAKRIRVIVLEPQGRAHIEDVEDSLEDFQRLVGGLIEHHQLTPPCPTGAGLHLFGNEEAIAEDLAPNLWGLVLGGPFLGPLVLFREDRHDHKVNITPADEQYWTGDLKRILDGQLEELGLRPREPYAVVIGWSGDEPPALQPEP